MKVVDIFESNDVKKIKPPAPRPKKTLWFDSYENWAQDLKLSHPESEAFKTSDEEIIALNTDEDKCYGKWDPMDQKGVTFDTPRTIQSVLGKNTLINRVLDTTEHLRKANAHQ